MTPKVRYAPPDVRFWANVAKSTPDACWLWTASTNRGYGRLYVNDARVSAHRFSYEMHYGTIPEGMCVCHRCDVPACVNPAHLFLGTNADNMADRDAKGRHRVTIRRGAATGNAKLSEADVREIRTRYAVGGVSHRALAREFGVGHTVVCRVVRRRGWTHVAESAS